MKRILLLGLMILSSVNTFAQLPQPALVGYWENWTAGSFVYFSEVDPRYNVIMVSFASYKNNNDYEMDFAPEPGKYWHDSTLFRTEMVRKQSEGKKVFLSLGGATYPIMLDSIPEKDGFVSSVGDILNDWNFDGIDIDLEGKSLNFNHFTIDSMGDERMSLMIQGIQEIMANYRAKTGKKLLLTMAPETHYIHGGMSDLYPNQFGGAYLPMIEALKDSIDMLNVQLYNSGDMPGINGKYYTQSTPDFILALTDAVITGFTGTGTLGTFSGLPASKVGVGLPSCQGWGYTKPISLDSTMRYLLGQGPQPGNYKLVQNGGYPDLAGMMTWSINTDVNCKDDPDSYVNLYDLLFNNVPYINISNADTILITEEDGGEIFVEVKKDSFVLPIDTSHWWISNLPSGVSIKNVTEVSDTVVKIILKGNSNKGDEQFHLTNLNVNVASSAFVNGKDTLSKNFGATLTSPGYFIPARIEAEDYHKMVGSEIRPTNDKDNNIKLGGGTDGAYSDYHIIVPETKKYAFLFRYATSINNKADYSILIDDVELFRDTLASTGGWDSFVTLYRTIELPEGKHTLRIVVNDSWYGLNWFEISEDGVGIKEYKNEVLNLYPNPVSDVLHFSKVVNGSLNLIDVTGKLIVQRTVNGSAIDISYLLPGFYQLILKTSNGSTEVGRFVKR